MKISTLIFGLLLNSLIAIAQLDSIKTNENSQGNIYFLRSTGSTGSALPFKIFIDDKLVCKLKNNKYSIQKLQPGKHTFSAQPYSSKLKVETEKFEIIVEPKIIYYLFLQIKTGFMWCKTECIEITENSAKQKIPKLNQQIECE